MIKSEHRTLFYTAATLVLLVAVGSAQAVTISTFLDENFDASSTPPTGWTLGGNGAMYTSGGSLAPSSPNSVRLGTSYSSGDVSTPVLDLNDATTATITFDYIWSTSAFGRFAYVDFFNGSGWSQLGGSLTAAYNGGILHVNESRTVTSGFAINNQFRIRSNSNSGGAVNIHIDNVKVVSDATLPSTTTIPEPATATLGLLAFGGFMLRRRRVA